jgi:hypothetical protein
MAERNIIAGQDFSVDNEARETVLQKHSDWANMNDDVETVYD